MGAVSPQSHNIPLNSKEHTISANGRKKLVEVLSTNLN
jgi:hypothetical protein